MSSNFFNGSAPAAWDNFRRLENLTLDSNALSGTFPAFLLALPALTVLNASANNISGSLPPSAGALNTSFICFQSWDRCSGACAMFCGCFCVHGKCCWPSRSLKYSSPHGRIEQ